MSFDPSNRSLKFWESTGTPSPKVELPWECECSFPHTPSHFLTLLGVCDVTPRLPLGPHPCNAFALTPGLPSSWPATLQPLCLGREPKARVMTMGLLKKRTACFFCQICFFIWMNFGTIFFATCYNKCLYLFKYMTCFFLFHFWINMNFWKCINSL